MFEPAVDRFGGAVAGAGVVEVGQHVQGPAFQGSTESDQLGELRGHSLGEVVDHGLQSLLPTRAVGVAVGGDDALVDAPGRFDLDVLVSGEHGLQPGDLLVGEQVSAGVQHSPDAVERVSGSAPMAEGGLLDALAALIDLLASQRDDVERVHHRGRLGQFLGGCGLVAGEAVHHNDLDPVPERGGLALEPGREHFLRPARDHVQQPGGAGAVTDRGQVDDDGDVLAAPAGVGPHVLVHADDADAIETSGVVDQQLLAGGQDRIVGGVPGNIETGGDPGDGQAIDDHALERPQRGVPGEDSAGLGCGRGVLTPHTAAVRASVPANSDLQHRGTPAQRDVGETPDNRASGDALLAALMAPVVRLAHATLQHRSMRLDQLPRHGQAQPVELAESIEIGRGKGSVEHVEVFQMASVGPSIIGRPRRLPRHRHAASSYTLICEEPDNLTLRVARDHVPYDLWQRQGFLETTEGNVVHYAHIEHHIQDLGTRFDIREIAFDRWGAVQMSQNLEDAGFTVVPFGQGFRDMSPPSKELMKLALEGRLAHGGHPILSWMVDNIHVRTDPAGNIKPDKQRSTEKIDGVVATIMALDRAIRGGNPHDNTSVYDSRGLLVL